MDIMGARDMQINTRPDPLPNAQAGPDLKWLELALSIEEQQYVFLHACMLGFH